MRTFLRTILKPLSFLPAILMMYVIFSFSAQDAETSSQLSYKVSRKVVEVGADVLDADFEAWEIDSLAARFHGPIRKLAHMTEYFSLAVSVAFPLYVYGLRGILLVLVAGFFCVAFACGDEFHQSKVAGRVPSKKDIAIDSIGILAGIIFTRIIGWTGRKTIFRPLSKSRKKNVQPAYNTDYREPYQKPHNALYQESYDRPYSGSCQEPYARPYNGLYQEPYDRPYQGSCNEPAPSVYPPDSASHPYGINRQTMQQPDNRSNYNRINYNSSNCNSNNYTEADSRYSNMQPVNPPASSYDDASGYDDAPENPDYLSEDMSFRKLMHEIKDQKKTAHVEKRAARKPKLQGEEIPDESADLEINELKPYSDLN